MKTKLVCVSALILSILLSMSCNNPQKSASDAVLDNIFTRTSIRSYTDKPLSDKQIETLLKAGMAAPSAKNMQPWSFVVVTDSALRASLVTKGVNRMYADAPCLIVVCGETDNLNWHVDCSAVTENILLAAHAIGLGAVWTACWPYEDRYSVVKNVLGIPDGIMPLAIIPVGYPAEQPAPKDKWSPGRIHKERW